MMCVKTTVLVSVLCLTVAWCPVVGAGPSSPTVLVNITLLVGFPSGQEAADASKLLLPGTVVVPGSVFKRGGGDLAKLMDKLKDAYGLGKIEASSTVKLRLGAGQEEVVNTPAGHVDLRVKLLAFDGGKAAFHVKLYEGDKLLGEPKLTVVRGQSGIVGSRDGEAAPYIFLVLRPETEVKLRTPEGEAVVTMPELVSQVQPSYPEEARKARLQGVVILECRIDKDGRVTEARPLRELGSGCTEAAVEAVRQWRYEPARGPDGKPVEVYMTVTVAFKLK